MKYKIAFLVTVLIFGNLFSQNKYRLKNISTTDGLSQSSVIAIHQDKFGQMWFGTRDGLNKYDGSRFTIFRNDVNDKSSISNNDILAIVEDNSGKIWVGTYNGLNCYDPVSGKFTRYLHTKANHTISNNAVWTIKEIGNEMWFGTSKGLTILNKKTGNFTSVFHSDTDTSTLPSNNILSIVKTKKGEIWIGTTKGLCQLTSRKGSKFSFKNYPLNPVDLLTVQSVIEDKTGNLWVGTKNKGLLKFDQKQKAYVPFLDAAKYREINSDIRSLIIDKQGSLWIGAYDGIYILGQDKSLQKINNTNNNNGIDKVKSVYMDKKGSIWIGCYYKGVNLWDVSNVNFSNYNQNSKKIPMSFDVVSSIIADKNHNIYFGTEGGGITIFNQNTEAVSYINSKTGQSNKNDIKSMCLSDDHILWIGTFSKGLSAYNTISKRIEDNRITSDLLALLKESGVYSLKTEGPVLWIGTFGKGLIRYDTANRTFQIIGNDNTKPVFLTNNIVRTILVDKQNYVWVGTQNGLNRIPLKNFNPQKYTIQHFFYDHAALSGDDILTLFQDSQHKIWVGTKAKGLHYFDGKKFNHINLKIGNTVITSIHSILEDDDKNLWISTNLGIIKYNTTKKNIVIYDQKDGLASNEFNDNSALKLDSNQFYFGSPSGATYFDAAKISLNQYSPQVLITDLKIKNETIHAEDKDGILEKSIGFTQTITLDYDKANFSINFAIPNYIRSKNNQYSYRLIGLENNWTTTKNAEANFAIQNPGTYVFEVRGANNDGVWNKTPATLTVVVNPAPWRSIWAFLLYGIIIGLGLYGLIWIMKSKARLKQKLELEYLETKRIEENNRAKLDFFTNISHEFRTPLTLILGPLQQILADYNGTNEMYKKLLVIEGSANHLLSLINRLMDFRKLENDQVTLESANGNIVKFTKEIFLSFIEYAKDGGYDYTFETSDEEISVYFDRYKLERVFYNLISNAFRYTPKGGTINIKINHDHENLFIAVEDSGVGISEEHIDKIFDLFFEVPTHNQVQKNYNKGTGIGLSIVKNIVKLHKGTIDVTNKTSGGVIFKVTLPLGREHLLDSEIIPDFKISDDIAQYTAQLEPSETIENEDIEDLIVNEEKQTILLVEDHKVLRKFMKNLLKKDYNIIEAENGKIAFEKALKFVPNLIISDVIMPEMVGTELCSKIKENLKTSHIPVILLTSRSSLVYKFEGLESGADDYISKPFNLMEFRLRVKNLLNSTERLKLKFSSEDSFIPSEITVSSLDEELLKKAFKIVEDNISNEQFDIPFFCSELGVSRTMLFLKVKAWTNFTPNEFIHEIRLKRAAQLLEQNKLNVSEISYKVGFNNPKYFSKCFQKRYGETPSQYSDKFYKSTVVF
ncbi:hybrid sensor histidine kinase/response regulator [Flavobacterium sp. WLB]|uniref:two-component regulator propeller domain-containing protein n=1 Tax=unclassified Flavobacterium TaxID=196869 RepID=UPI0006ABBE4D|nr:MULTISPECIES: two-component regulator propeller domain-containing protein [unclassified Flavobacterium]KOP38296.1 histidine kinase [Flavobacterium sp. VMW]OWU92205.1 histidine kinase [Flavobacterium sp. NLM]PUU69752.1 hybrid sensor histidine kinase/response regulator [Flavobacterium sp. WLB]